MAPDGFNINIVTYWCLFPVVIITLLFAFLEKRKHRQDCCYGRPALVAPFEFLDSYRNRTAYCLAFGTATSTVISLIFSDYTLGSFSGNLWIPAIVMYIQALIGSLSCFPFFLCFSTRYKALGAAICIGYSALWLALKVTEMIFEINDVTETPSIQETQANVSFLAMRKSEVVLQGLPLIGCYCLLIAISAFTIYRCIHSKNYLSQHQLGQVAAHQEDHVRWLLRRSKDEHGSDSFPISHQNLIKRMHDEYKVKLLTSFPFFKYPTRIVSMAFVQVNVLYWIAVLVTTNTAFILLIIYEWVQNLSTSDTAIVVTDIVIAFSVFSLVFSLVVSAVQIFYGLRKYRYHMLRIFRGDRSFIPRTLTGTPQRTLVTSMRYPGFQIAFMVWGLIVAFAFMLIITLTISLLIVYLVENQLLGTFLLSVVQLFSFPFTVLVVFYLQIFISKRFLLQKKLNDTDEHPPLNVDNRKFYELFYYFTLFASMAVGLFSSFLRIAKGILIGIIIVGRVDRSVLPRDMEKYDAGYRSYISMLLMDNAHNNPTMRVFVHLLWTRVLRARLTSMSSDEVDVSDQEPLPQSVNQRYIINNPRINSQQPDSRVSIDQEAPVRARTRWHLAYTLMNNPEIIKLRKRDFSQRLDSSELSLGIAGFHARARDANC